MIKWTLKIILAFWLVHYGLDLLPGGRKYTKSSDAVAHKMVHCPDGYAYEIPEEPFKGLYVKCELFDQFYYFVNEEKDYHAAMQYVIID